MLGPGSLLGGPAQQFSTSSAPQLFTNQAGNHQAGPPPGSWAQAGMSVGGPPGSWSLASLHEREREMERERMIQSSPDLAALEDMGAPNGMLAGGRRGSYWSHEEKKLFLDIFQVSPLLPATALAATACYCYCLTEEAVPGLLLLFTIIIITI